MGLGSCVSHSGVCQLCSGRLLKLPVAKGVRASTRHVRRLSSLIDDLPISAKAFAASSVLLLCLIGLGANGYLALSFAP